MSSLRGMCMSHMAAENVLPLRPEWLYIEFGWWNWDNAYQYGGIPWVFHYYGKVPKVEDVARAMKHSSYSGWHILGQNEADINGVPFLTPIAPHEYVKLCVEQMDVIRQADKKARFVIWGGTQMRPMFQKKWFWRVWDLFPRGRRRFIKAVGTDFYVQGSGYGGMAEHPEKWLRQAPINSYFQKCRAALDADPTTAGLELWCHEIGLAESPKLDATRVHTYPAKVQEVMDKYCTRWAWFTQMPFTTYLTLLTSNGVMTDVGKAFAELSKRG